MNDADLRHRLDRLTATVPAQPDAYGLVQARAARLRRRRASAGVATAVAVAVVAVGVPLALHSRQPSSTQLAADGVVTRSCDRTGFEAALRLGPMQAVYGIRLTAGEAARWIDPRTFEADPVLAALPPAEQVSFCLVVGDLELTDTSGASTSAHVALVSVVDGRASARYIAGADYSMLPDEPAPGITKAEVVPFVVLNGETVASAAPSQVAATPRCGPRALTADFSYDGLVDGAPQGTITVENTSAEACSIFTDLTFKALDASGAELPVPPGGVLARTRVSAVLGPHAANTLRVIVDGDPSTNICSPQSVLTPARFVLDLRTLSISVVNRGGKAVQGRDAVSGCPNRIYAGGADIQ